MTLLTSLTRMWLTRSMRPFYFTNEYDSNLNYAETQNLGLYVHIPFCRTLCDFCPYCKTVYSEDTADAYIDALKKEIEIVGSGCARKKVGTLYFGGGTPALAVNRIGEIIEKLRQYFDITEGIGLELHPADVTPDTLLKLKEAGITRISIGVQSFGEEYLDLLGRRNHDFAAMFASLKQVSFETVAMDFIFALPGQTFETIKKDIDTAFANGANHIALYPFIDFTYTDRSFDKMPESHKKELLYRINEYCEKKGYVRDSIWTYGLPNTKKYSSMTRDNFIGFGCSATTLLKDCFKVNTFSIPHYIERIKADIIPTALTIRFTPRQRMIYYLFWTAYTMKIDPAAFRVFFGKKLKDCYGFEIWFAKKLGFAIEENGIYRLTNKGAYYYHYYENFYTLSYIDQMWNLMRTEAFPSKLVIR